MKPISVILWSLVGMATTSGAVAWLTPGPATAAAASAPPIAAPVASPAERLDTEPSATEPPLAQSTPAEPVAPAHFVTDGLLHVEGRLGHETLPADQPRESFVFVAVDATTERVFERRLPVDVSIVVDRSGSMKGSRLRNAVAAARGMVDRLGPDDRVSLVAYDNDAELLVPSTPVRSLDRRGFDRMLDSLRHGGNTCLSCGLQLGLAQVRGRGEGARRVLLLSDGKANRGMTTMTALRGLGDTARRDQTAIASIGVDVDYDERTMFAVSEASNGRHYFAEHPRMLPDVFEQERVALVGTVADRVDVDVTLADGIELLEVVDRPHRREGDTVSLSLGSFAAGEAKTVLMRVLVHPGAHERARPVAAVQLAYRDAGEGREHTERGALGVGLTSDDAQPASLAPAVEARLGRKDAFDALVAANEAFGRGDVAEAEKTLETARRQIRRRRERTAEAPVAAAPELDADFEQQLQALGSASSNFKEASRGGPPKAAAKKRKGKASIRLNAQAADPFSN